MVTVSVETILPDAMIVVGEKLHVAPVGRPEQAKAIADVVLNPFCGVTVTVSAPLLPAVMVRDGAETASVKSGVGVVPVVTVSTAALLVTDPAEFVTVTANCSPLVLAAVAGVVYVAEVAPVIAVPFMDH